MILFLALASCTRNESEKGCWETKSMKSNGMDIGRVLDAVFCFYEDGSMEIKGKSSRVGTYERSDNGKMIVITYSNGAEEVFSNVEIDGSSMNFDGRDFSIEMEKQ